MGGILDRLSQTILHHLKAYCTPVLGGRAMESS